MQISMSKFSLPTVDKLDKAVGTENEWNIGPLTAKEFGAQSADWYNHMAEDA